MARFIRHESCEKCGSRDNKGVYDDGSTFCFGCHSYKHPDLHTFSPDSASRCGPTDLELLGPVGRRLVKLLPTAKKISNGDWFDPVTQRTCFLYNNAEGQLVCIQGRSNGGSGPKYLNWGSTYEVIDINGSHGPPAIVITEDKLSAIQVSNVCDAFPALGTQFQKHKLTYLYNKGYRKIAVWLDRDKWKEGREICELAQWMGFSARAILTDLDPKHYSIEEIKEYLK